MESLNRILKGMLQYYINITKNHWIECLKIIEFVYNDSLQESIYHKYCVYIKLWIVYLDTSE